MSAAALNDLLFLIKSACLSGLFKSAVFDNYYTTASYLLIPIPDVMSVLKSAILAFSLSHFDIRSSHSLDISLFFPSYVSTSSFSNSTISLVALSSSSFSYSNFSITLFNMTIGSATSFLISSTSYCVKP